MNESDYKKWEVEKFFKQAFCINGEAEVIYNKEDFKIDGVIKLTDSIRGEFYLGILKKI